ncbi:hypothetical protein [Cellulomonas marina]|uniref:Subtilisin inhibitor-like n=1 Tax=Cellulomonas marina TaxID=988821 RepID=A0A1I0X9U6_9CELL|nr:hypothetical protein [Cellulomonas marina]SFA97447.1 hypothetical protein SAMN05421867_104215 [Cellulomonas marina]
MNVLRTALTVGATAALLVSAAVAPAVAGPKAPGPKATGVQTGFHSGKPIKGLEQRLDEWGIPEGVLSVQVVCPKGTTEQYAVRARAARYDNYGRYADNPGQPVTCTGRPQVVQVDVWGDYWGNPCRMLPGIYPAEAQLVRVLPDGERWENWQVLASTRTALPIDTAGPGLACDEMG